MICFKKTWRAWNPKQQFFDLCLVKHPFFHGNDLVHRPIDGQPFSIKWMFRVPGWAPTIFANGIIAPVNRVKSPQLPIYFRPLIGAPCHSIYNDRRGPPCINSQDLKLQAHKPRILLGYGEKTLKVNAWKQNYSNVGKYTIH